MQYKLLVNTEDNLEDSIQGYLNDGWELYGFPFFVDWENGHKKFFAQAVIYKG